jgi:anti-sigma28 factor (negative regulator of flagellin synthesis)
MSSISSIPLSSSSASAATERAGVIARIGPRGAAGAAGEAFVARAGDSVEVSPEALAASAGQAQSEKVARIREQLANGTYNVDEKLAVVADRIARVLNGRSEG